jgi:hypothetical protein
MMLVALALTTMLAQGRAPQRDQVATPTVGTASISGIVVDDESEPKPVRRALVTLTGADLHPNRGVITDDNGRFTIEHLPAGAFTLTATKAAFVTSVYGAKRAGRPGTAIVVRAGEAATNISVRLWRGAVVSGTVRDVNGEPVPAIPVNAMRSHDFTSELFTLTNNGGLTNERGEFRIYGLEPGSYVIAAKPSPGGGGPLTSMSEAEVDAALEAIRTRSAAAVARPAAGASTSASEHSFDFAPVFYPGTSVAGDAKPIVLSAGQEVGSIDLTLLRVPTATVSGIVIRPDGVPAAGASLQIVSASDSGVSTTLEVRLETTTDRTGAFVVPQVTPGDYDVVVRAPATPPPSPSPNGGMVSPFPQGPQLWGHTTIAVAGTDLSNLQIPLAAGLTLSGRIQVEPAADGSTPDLAGWSVLSLPPELMTSTLGVPSRTLLVSTPARAKADGTFVYENIPPGRRTLTVAGPLRNGPWEAASAMLGGRDLLDQEFTLTAADAALPLTITLSQRKTTVSGQLETKSGAPATDVFVIAFAADHALWGSHSRRVSAVRPDATGHYTIAGLPPGDYRLAAVTDIDPNEWDDPSVLAALMPASIAIKVQDGETTAPTLRIGG